MKNTMQKINMCILMVMLFMLIGSGLVYAGGGRDDAYDTPTQQQPQSQQRPQSQQSQSQPQQPAQQTVQQPAPPPSQPASQYFTGSGGRGMRLAVLEPMGRGLNENQEYLPAMIQGVLVSNISKYSAISVLDRVSLDRVIMETLDPFYEDDWDVITLGNIAQVGHMVTGSIIQTSTGFSLQINVIDTANGHTVASYSGVCTAAELDDHSAIHRATLDLLPGVNVQLTARARNELGRASTQEEITAQAALARGVTAQRYGTEVEALSYFLQAAAVDPFLEEAETRLNYITASITSGSMGADVRNDMQWRSQWIARLRETEEFVAQYLRTNPAFYLVFSSSSDQWEIEYERNNTITLGVEISCLPDPLWFETINRLTTIVRNGLLATGRAEAWRLNWPAETQTRPSPFADANNTYPVAVEILNDRGDVIGRQNINIRFGWYIHDGMELTATIVPYIQFGAKAAISGIDQNAVTDTLNIRIASINGIASSAASQLGIRVLPEQEYNNIHNIAEHGLNTDNLRQYDIRFERNRNLLRGYSGSSVSIVIPWGVTVIDENSGLRNKELMSVSHTLGMATIGATAVNSAR